MSQNIFDQYPFQVVIETPLPCKAGIRDYFVSNLDMIILAREDISYTNMVKVTYGFINSHDAVDFKLRFG